MAAGDDDILRRLDAHLERGNELMERIDLEFQKNREFHARTVDEQREFMRVTLLRVERIGRDEAQELRRMNDELERQGKEGREEARVGRDALFRILDRLDNLDPPAAPA